MESLDHGCVSRRCVLGAATATGATALLSGCSALGIGGQANGGQMAGQNGAQPMQNGGQPMQNGGAVQPGTPPSRMGAPAPGQPNAPAPANAPAGTALASLADIPVGGGVVLARAKLVITQPAKGKVKAFTSTCPHAGCQVNEVADGTINCPCHGSKFAIADGTVTDGPAPRGLKPVKVAVRNGKVVRA